MNIRAGAHNDCDPDSTANRKVAGWSPTFAIGDFLLS